MTTSVRGRLLYAVIHTIQLISSVTLDESMSAPSLSYCQCDGQYDSLTGPLCRLQHHVCDIWVPHFNVSQLTQICRRRAMPSALLTSVCDDVIRLCAHIECRRHESVRSALEFVCNSSSLAVYREISQCLHVSVSRTFTPCMQHVGNKLQCHPVHAVSAARVQPCYNRSRTVQKV